MGFRVQGPGFRVWGLGFGVYGFWFRVWGLGFRAQGLGFGVYGFWFRVWGLGLRVWGAIDNYILDTCAEPSQTPRSLFGLYSAPESWNMDYLDPKSMYNHSLL